VFKLLSENINSRECGANLLLELEHWVKRQVKYSCSLDLLRAQTICCSVVKTLSNCLTVLMYMHASNYSTRSLWKGFLAFHFVTQ